MTPHSERSTAEQRLTDGSRALPLTVLVFLLLDVVSTLIGQAYGLTNLGRSGLLPAAQMFLVAAAAAATMYRRPRTAVALTAAVVILVFTAGPSGEEVWLLVITGVTAAVRASRRQLALVGLGQLVYAVAFALQTERRHAGWGWSTGLLTIAFATVALAVGLVARRLLQARDLRRLRVVELEREQSEIRAIERGRLADELQVVVTQGLLATESELDAVARRSPDLESLRSGLEEVDRHSRSLLTDLRTLLDVLRREPVAQSDFALTAAQSDVALTSDGSGSRGWVDLVRARHVKLAATAVCGVLAVRAAFGLDVRPDAEVLVQVIGLVACAVASWRPAVGASLAGVALLVSCLLDPPGSWDVLASTLLCLMAALSLGPRRIWLLLLAVAGYSGVLALTDSTDPRNHVVLLCYAAGLAIAVGLAARHFLAAREDSLRQLVDLARERERVKAEERTAVARELHDVVAHSLSITTMLVMATSLSNDRSLLTGTLDKVRHSTEAARQELSTLLFAMRGTDADPSRPAPLITPLATARGLARHLSDHGYRPVMQIDPAADALDHTTQRTLARIMQEGATNILRYTPPGSTCSYTLAITEASVRLSIDSPLAASERSSDLSLGWGLRGIRERVELTHGTFTAGPQRDRWLLEVTLPTSAHLSTALRPRPDAPGPKSPFAGRAQADSGLDLGDRTATEGVIGSSA